MSTSGMLRVPGAEDPEVDEPGAGLPGRLKGGRLVQASTLAQHSVTLQSLHERV